MALTRPVVGAEVSAADFGQPIYDLVVPGVWTALPLLNGATSSPTAQYRKLGDVVQLRGTVTTVTGSTGAAGFAQLPAGFRPAISTEYGLIMYTGTRTPGALVIGADGLLRSYDVAGAFGLNSIGFSVTT